MPFDVQNLDVQWDEKSKSYKNPDHAFGPLTAAEFFKYVEEWDSNNYLMCAGIIAKKNPNLKHVDVEESEGNLENGLVTNMPTASCRPTKGTVSNWCGQEPLGQEAGVLWGLVR